MSRYIFLDIDGVLNNVHTESVTPQGYTGVSRKLVRRLAAVVKETGARVVLTSDWKYGWKRDPALCEEDASYLNDRLSQHGVYIYDRTYDEKIFDEFYTDRGNGIYHFIEKNADCESYVVLDDHVFADYDEKMRKHLVLTDPEKGLTDADVQKIYGILMGNVL